VSKNVILVYTLTLSLSAGDRTEMSLRDIGDIKECQKTAGHFCTTMPTIGFGPNMEKRFGRTFAGQVYSKVI